jgi:hypothetical protein
MRNEGEKNWYETVEKIRSKTPRSRIAEGQSGTCAPGRRLFAVRLLTDETHNVLGAIDADHVP